MNKLKISILAAAALVAPALSIAQTPVAGAPQPQAQQLTVDQWQVAAQALQAQRDQALRQLADSNVTLALLNAKIADQEKEIAALKAKLDPKPAAAKEAPKK